eukprot:5191446-Prymnesium_polylepis.3
MQLSLKRRSTSSPASRAPRFLGSAWSMRRRRLRTKLRCSAGSGAVTESFRCEGSLAHALNCAFSSYTSPLGPSLIFGSHPALCA